MKLTFISRYNREGISKLFSVLAVMIIFVVVLRMFDQESAEILMATAGITFCIFLCMQFVFWVQDL